MAGRADANSKLDVMLALRQMVQTFWDDFGPIIVCGLVLLLLPGVVGQMLLKPADPGLPVNTGMATLVQTLNGLGTMIFVAVVSFGTLARLAGRPLDLRGYTRIGLLASQPGLLVGLVMGIAGMAVGVVYILGSGSAVGRLAGIAAMGALVYATVIWATAVPAAIAERLAPVAALRRSAELTRGTRMRIFGTMLVAVLGILPALMLLTTVVFGVNSGPEAVQDVMARWTLASPGMWLVQLGNLLVAALVAPLPAVIYHQLRR